MQIIFVLNIFDILNVCQTKSRKSLIVVQPSKKYM